LPARGEDRIVRRPAARQAAEDQMNGLLPLASAAVDSVAAAAQAAPAAAAQAAPLLSLASLVSLLTLTALEIVLGIDNVIFIAILTGRLPAPRQPRARKLGISLAVITRVLLLLSLSFLMGLTKPLFTLLGAAVSGKQLILILGGVFLIGKSTVEIHDKLEGAPENLPGARAASMAAVIVQIMLIDVVFSLDSVITAVGMTNQIPVMIAAVVLAAAVMVAFSGPVSDFVHRNPTIKILALAFLILIGVMLVAEGFGEHVNKGYVYFAMAFSLGVEFLNMRVRAKETPVALRHSRMPDE
jgi:predicted tellurium resistance membrane protein TerC